jgi:DNA polymerase-3 subunit delta'
LTARLQKPAQASVLLNVAGGAPLMALALAEGDRIERRKQLFDGFYGTRLGKIDPVCAAGDWVTGDIKEHLRWLISWHMDMIRLKMAPSSPRLTNPDMAAPLRRLALEQSNQSLFAGLDSAVRLLQLTTTQVNLQLMIEAFFSDCPDV